MTIFVSGTVKQMGRLKEVEEQKERERGSVASTSWFNVRICKAGSVSFHLQLIFDVQEPSFNSLRYLSHYYGERT